MATSASSRRGAPAYMPDADRHRQEISNWAREVHQGHIANTGSVTLGTSVAATSVVDSRVGANSFIGLMPTTLNAAAALATSYISSRSAEGFTITHANTATADRAFVYCILG